MHLTNVTGKIRLATNVATARRSQSNNSEKNEKEFELRNSHALAYLHKHI